MSWHLSLDLKKFVAYSYHEMDFPAYINYLHSIPSITDALVSTGLAALGYKYVNIGKCH